MEAAKRNLDLTEGVIWKKFLLFLLPIAIGTLFQQFYSTVDAVIVGQFVGADALAAVGGSAAVIVQLVVGIFTGLSSGATVVISHGYGAGDKEKLHHAVHSAVAFSLLAGAIITVVGILLTPDALRWAREPPGDHGGRHPLPPAVLPGHHPHPPVQHGGGHPPGGGGCQAAPVLPGGVLPDERGAGACSLWPGSTWGWPGRPSPPPWPTSPAPC